MQQISEKQLAANRANAKLGKGPTSIDGKKRSSQNARRHGVTGQTTVMTEEDRIKHDNFCSRMIAELRPYGEMETFLASSVAEEGWRLNYSRVRPMQQHDRHRPFRWHRRPLRHRPHAEIHTAITSATVVREQAKKLELLYSSTNNASIEPSRSTLRPAQTAPGRAKSGARYRSRERPPPQPSRGITALTLYPRAGWVRFFECRNQPLHRPVPPPHFRERTGLFLPKAGQPVQKTRVSRPHRGFAQAASASCMTKSGIPRLDDQLKARSTTRTAFQSVACYTELSWPYGQHSALSGIITTIAPQLRAGCLPDLSFSFQTKGRPPQHWRAFFLLPQQS